MKVRKWTHVLLFMAMLWLGAMFPASTVEAGIQSMVVDEETFEDSAYWRNANGDVVAEKGKLTFTKDSVLGTSYILKSKLQPNSILDTIALLECTVNLRDVPAGESFVVAFGLQGLNSSIGAEGNVEIAFTNNNGIKVGVNAYKEPDNPNTLCKMKSCGISVNQDVKLKIEIGGDASIKVTVNGQKIHSGILPVDAGGRMGFLQTGRCAVDITQFQLIYYEYEQPENVNVSEDFEQETWDISKLSVSNYGVTEFMQAEPGYVTVEEYEGNRVLMIKNAQKTRISSRYQYSNFELTFDVPYVQMENVYDETGRCILKALSSFCVQYGAENMAPSSMDTSVATDEIVVVGNLRWVKSNRLQAFETVAINKKEDKFKPFSIKVSVVDGTVTVGKKWVEESKFETLATYKLDGGSPLGYVQIFLKYTGCMALDNIKITNLDNNPKLTETEFQSGLVEGADAVYEPMERKYLESTAVTTSNSDESGGIPYYVIVFAGATVAGGVMLAISAVVARRRKKHVTGGE